MYCKLLTFIQSFFLIYSVTTHFYLRNKSEKRKQWKKSFGLNCLVRIINEDIVQLLLIIRIIGIGLLILTGIVIVTICRRSWSRSRHRWSSCRWGRARTRCIWSRSRSVLFCALCNCFRGVYFFLLPLWLQLRLQVVTMTMPVRMSNPILMILIMSRSWTMSSLMILTKQFSPKDFFSLLSFFRFIYQLKMSSDRKKLRKNSV